MRWISTRNYPRQGEDSGGGLGGKQADHLDTHHLYLQDFILPSITAFPGLSKGKGDHWKYSFIFSREGLFDTTFLRSPDDIAAM
jgi:hypothetical protein